MRSDVEARRQTRSRSSLQDEQMRPPVEHTSGAGRAITESELASNVFQRRHFLAASIRHIAMSVVRRVPNSSALVLALALIALTVLPNAVSAALFPKKSPVVQVSASNLKREVLGIEKPTIVAFTAPWCGHCQRLAPEFDRAARSLEGIVKFANIDCDAEANKPMCGRYGVQGFPTIKLFPPTPKRLPRDYRGERTAKALVEYAVDSLPRNVQKVNAEELGSFIQRDPPRPKVLLFSNKATSSPLYKSLALDFRKSMTFAFARGDQSPVRSAARVHLGVNIQSDADLPVLLMLPPRTSETFEKGSFETYEGKLKYSQLKEWLDGLISKHDVREQSDSANGAKSPSAKASKANAKKAPREKSSGSVTDSASDPLPEGAAYEWKPPSSRQHESEKDPASEMISKERASELAEEVKAQQEALSRKSQEKSSGEGSSWELKGQEVNVTMKHGSGSAPSPEPEGHVSSSDADESTGSKLREDPFSDPERFKDHLNKGPYVYTDAQQADLHAINQVLEEAGVYGAVDEAIDRVGDAAKNVRKSAAETFKNVKEAADSIAAKLGSAGKLSSAEDEADEERRPFVAKRRALLSSFERWLAGENPDWQENYAEEFMKATKHVEELLSSDPARAEELAWENEEWMLRELSADREKMADVLGKEKRANLDEMIQLIESRLQARKEERTKRRQEDGVDAALKAVLRDEEREKEARAAEASNAPSSPHHDEL